MFFVFCTRFCIAKIVKRDFFGIAIIGKYITFCDCDMLTSNPVDHCSISNQKLLLLSETDWLCVRLTLCETSEKQWWTHFLQPTLSPQTPQVSIFPVSQLHTFIPYLSTNHLRPSFPSTFHNSLLPLWLIHN